MTIQYETFGASPKEGNGVNTDFPSNGLFENAGEMKVTHTDSNGVITTLTDGVHFTYSGYGAASGSVTYPKAGSGISILPSSEYITIAPDLPFTQLVDLVSQGKYRPEVAEQVADNIVRLIQQLRDNAGRAMVLPPGTPTDFDKTLPSPGATKLFGYSYDGKSISLYDLIDSIFVNQEAEPTTDGSLYLWQKTSTGDLYYLKANAWVLPIVAVANKAAGQALTPISGASLLITSSDGGMFKAITGAAPGTYSDDGGSYCGTQFIPSGGDGSTAWVRSNYTMLDVGWFGAVGDGVTDDTVSIQAAFNSGIPVTGSAGVYLVTKLIVPSDFYCDFPRSFELKLKNNTDDKLIENSDTVGGNTNITIIGGKFNGNKANQLAGSTSRGIYLVNCSEVSLIQNDIFDCEDHGVHISNDGTREGNRIIEPRVSGCGKSGSSVGGSGIAITNGLNDQIISPYITDCIRAGVRPSGSGLSIISPTILRCGNGGIVPESGATTDLTITSPVVRDCVDNGAGSTDICGIRLVGTDAVNIVNPQISGCDQSGIQIFNGCNNVTISNPIITNNGQAGSGSGILVSNSGLANLNIDIDNPRCFDTQGVKTQEYGISILNSSDSISVTGGRLNGNKTGRLNINTTGTDVKIMGAKDLSTEHIDLGSNTLTGTTTDDVIVSKSIIGGELSLNSILRVKAFGDISGTAGTKIIRLKIGATSLLLINESAGETLPWKISAEILVNTATAQRVVAVGVVTGSVESTSFINASEAISSGFTVSINGQLANSADSIIVRGFTIDRVR